MAGLLGRRNSFRWRAMSQRRRGYQSPTLFHDDLQHAFSAYRGGASRAPFRFVGSADAGLSRDCMAERTAYCFGLGGSRIRICALFISVLDCLPKTNLISLS
jgi:hypothetical protein